VETWKVKRIDVKFIAVRPRTVYGLDAWWWMFASQQPAINGSPSSAAHQSLRRRLPQISNFSCSSFFPQFCSALSVSDTGAVARWLLPGRALIHRRPWLYDLSSVRSHWTRLVTLIYFLSRASQRLSDCRLLVGCSAACVWFLHIQGGNQVSRWCNGKAFGLAITRSQVQILPRQRCVTTLGKLFLPMCLCHQAV